MMLSLFTLPLVLAGAFTGSHVDSFDQATEPTYHSVSLSQLRYSGDLPEHAEQVDWQHWSKVPYRMPRIVLDGAGEAYFDVVNWSPRALSSRSFVRLADGNVCVRTDMPGDVTGTLYYPTTDWAAQVALRFEIDAGEGLTDAAAFSRARARHYGRLLDREISGAAWFRHRINESRTGVDGTDAEMEAFRRRDGSDSSLERSFGLLSGGRALSENLQLDRLMPASASGGHETVALDDIDGVSVREFNWEPLLSGSPPKLDVLARMVPADQYAVFFPSFQHLIEVVDEASDMGAPILTVFEDRSQDAGTRARYERQLCIELDTITRVFGPQAIKSVAITGSDPYLRTGSDVAVLLEAVDVEGVLSFVRARQAAASEGLEPGRIELESGDLRIYGVQGQGRAISSFVAAMDNVVVVSNSMTQLARVLATARGEAPAQATLDEYHFFRERYLLGDERESALIVVTDAAIRRWCGPRSRILASRRTRAAAVLADLTAKYDRPLLAGETLSELPSATHFELGDLSLLPSGVHSSIYGRLGFQTPIAEFDLERVTAGEAELYERWRRGYESNWSNYFDPIAARLTIGEEGLAFDLTVMPLIVGTDYAELAGFAGEARISSTSGDPHTDSLLHFVMAIDTEGEVVREIGESLTGMVPQLGADAMKWMGGSMAIYLDSNEWVRQVLESTAGQDEVMDLLLDDINQIPLVVYFDVKSGLRLATFLTSIRAWIDQTVPGMLRWEDQTKGEQRYMQITSDGNSDNEPSIFYGTTSSAFVISLNEEALLRALARDAAGRADPEARIEGAWIGESLGFEIGLEGLRIYELFEQDSLQKRLRHASWDNLPILNEWKRRYPERDPVAVHTELWGDTLRCPGGGEYVWNPADHTIESTVFGHPGAQKKGVDIPPILQGVQLLRFGLTFEHDGLRSRVELLRE